MSDDAVPREVPEVDSDPHQQKKHILRCARSRVRGVDRIPGYTTPSYQQRHPSGLIFSDARFAFFYRVHLTCGHTVTLRGDEHEKPVEGTTYACLACGPR